MELTNDQIREVILAEQKAKQANEKGSFAEKKYKLLLAEHERIVAENEALMGVANAPKKPFVIKPRLSKKENEAVPCLVWSDWHVEERVDPRTISGKNKYTLDIAKDRVTRVAQSSLKLMQEVAARATVNEVAVFLIGDFITGNIHEENVENAQLEPAYAAVYAQELIESALDFLLTETPYTYTLYCKAGNHSRITRKVHSSTELGNSLEYALFTGLLKKYMAGGRVKVFMEPSYYSIATIYGKRIRYHHGHAVSYGGGVGGLHIPLRKAIKSWNETERADFDVMGHYHSFLEHTTHRYMVNGSLIGYNAYAERIKAVLEAPMQGFFTVNKKYGITNIIPVFAE